jgi:hypothetical protein
MITAERIRHSGAVVLTALVTDGRDKFYHRITFCGYSEREARSEFRRVTTRDGLRIVRD